MPDKIDNLIPLRVALRGVCGVHRRRIRKMYPSGIPATMRAARRIFSGGMCLIMARAKHFPSARCTCKMQKKKRDVVLSAIVSDAKAFLAERSRRQKE